MTDDPMTRLLDVAQASTSGTSSGWPSALHGHGHDHLTLRKWLTQACSFPRAWHVIAAECLGLYGSTPATMTIQTPEGPIVVRFDRCDDIARPAPLRTTIVKATGGHAAMRTPKGPEAADFHRVFCLLADVAEMATVADETRDQLAPYLADGDQLLGLDLSPGQARHVAVRAIYGRQHFGPPQATAWLRRDLEPGSRWAVIHDEHEPGAVYVRIGELGVYMRHVLGVRPLGQVDLDALVKEIGGSRLRFESDLRSNGSNRVRVDLYRMPEEAKK